MTVREQPWNYRRATTRHSLWHRNLLDLHALTAEWLAALGSSRPAHLLDRRVDEGLNESLTQLEQLAASDGAERGLESLLDDSSPDDLLGRLDHSVNITQAWVLRSILEQVGKNEKSAALNQLEQASWKAGRRCADLRWKGLGADARADLRGVLAAYRDNALWSRPARDGLLVIRAVPTELRLELLACPHESPYEETASAADALCELHAHWTRGYVYDLNTRVHLEHESRSKTNARCRQRWLLEPLSS